MLPRWVPRAIEEAPHVIFRQAQLPLVQPHPLC